MLVEPKEGIDFREIQQGVARLFYVEGIPEQNRIWVFREGPQNLSYDDLQKLKDVIKELYPDSKRLILKDELEEMAYLFFKLDEEEYSRLCLAAASTLTEKDSFIMINPFLKMFLEHNLNHYIKVMRETTAPGVSEKDHSPKIITN